MFYLVLPPDFKAKDVEAEVFAVTLSGRRVSYRSLSDPLLSVEEDDEAPEGIGGDPPGESENRPGAEPPPVAEGEDAGVASAGPKKSGLVSKTFKRALGAGDDDSGVSSAGSEKTKKNNPFTKAFKFPSIKEEQEVVYQFRVLLDGNEKFIWLQAAAELGRLSAETAIRLASAVGATKKLFALPTGGRARLMALRYAEWARLVDENKNVSKFRFDVNDVDSAGPHAQNGGGVKDDGRFDSTKLLKIIPSYAYKNRRMTAKDLYHEMTSASERWEDFRGQTVKDRDEETVGTLHAEVLACHGLPKLDKLASTDAVCYFVCGPFAFATDVIYDFLSPVWPSKSRRACIFPLFHAYQKLYVGVFDNDGPVQHDDFAGRVVVDVARLRPGSEYDIFLPLRQYANAFVRRPRGAIRLRLRVEWDDERRALLSYLRLPRKTEELGNAVTVDCADLKAFRNVVLTVHGKDIPGRYKQLVQKGIKREIKLYQFVIKTTLKEGMIDIALYVNPSVSLCIFIAWMHCVYSNCMSYVPVYLVAGIIALLVRNYFKYGVNEEFNFGFAPITISEVFQVLLFGGPSIKPIKVTRQSDIAKFARFRSSQDELAGVDENDDTLHRFRMDGDHMEFPFSEAGRYAKKTLPEACVDASTMFREDDDEDMKPPSKLELWSKKAKKTSKDVLFPKANREDDDKDEEDEFGLMVETAAAQTDEIPPESINEQRTRIGPNSTSVDHNQTEAIPDKVWKRVADPSGLPEQDAKAHVKARRTLKEDLIFHKDLLHKYSMRMFDDRMFIATEDGETLVLNNAIGTNKHRSPIVAKIAEYVAPVLEMLKVGLSAWRSIFNIFTWRDPLLTSLFFFGAIFLLCVLLVFPWRKFFFASGLVAVGPQNWCLRTAGFIPQEKRKPPNGESAKTEHESKKKATSKKPSVGRGPPGYFQFHNHLTTDHGTDLREWRSSDTVHRAVVPNSPLISRRFYDWPPNPSLSKVDIYSK